jgi:hypothetical protein
MATKASEEQVLYANILNKGMLIGLIGLVVTFIIYGAGILEPKIPLDKVQDYWVMSVHDYLEASDIQAGWAWMSNLGYGDMLNFVPIAFLAGLSIVCYLAILPGLLKKGDKAYVIIAIVEVLVLCLAASGLLGSGGH